MCYEGDVKTIPFALAEVSTVSAEKPGPKTVEAIKEQSKEDYCRHMTDTVENPGSHLEVNIEGSLLRIYLLQEEKLGVGILLLQLGGEGQVVIP